jgi:hypothetical protein
MKIGMSMTPPKAKLPLELLISCHQQHQRDTHADLCECRDTAGAERTAHCRYFRGDKNV